MDISKDQPIVSIEDAIVADSYHLYPLILHSQLNVEEKEEWQPTDWTAYKHVVEGQVRIGGQEHFYLETQNCVAIPGECDEIDIISSTQSVSDVQIEVSQALGVPRHKVNVKVKRIGGELNSHISITMNLMNNQIIKGGFGGKESCCGLFATAAAVGAVKYRQPVSFMLERYDDMAISGTRHPFLYNYKLALDKDGRFLDINVHCYNNAGYLIELSKGVMGLLTIFNLGKCLHV